MPRPLLPPLLLCLALLLGCGGATSGDPPATAEPAVPHLILVSIDTLRADRLGCYGHDAPTSPTLDALARESWLFEEVTATSSSTAPCTMSMFSGLLPRVHGIFNERPAWPGPGVPLLPRLLQRAGWHTVAFADGGIVTEPYGFHLGFDRFDSVYEPFDRKLERVEAWLDEADDEPTFLFLHTYGVHSPYLPPEAHDLFTDPGYTGPLRERVEDLRSALGEADRSHDLVQLQADFLDGRQDFTPRDVAYLKGLYDGCLHGVDAGLGRLLERLEGRGWLDRAWLVVTSDHGEAFGEHGTYSHRQIHQEELRVPLLVRPPGGRDGRRLSGRVSQLDLAPTLLTLLDQPVPVQMQGRSLWPFEALDADRTALVNGGDLRRDAVLDGTRKALHTIGDDKRVATSLYDLAVDPGERHDLAGTVERKSLYVIEQLLRDMRAECEALAERVGAPLVEGAALDPEREAELRGLGYVR